MDFTVLTKPISIKDAKKITKNYFYLNNKEIIDMINDTIVNFAQRGFNFARIDTSELTINENIKEVFDLYKEEGYEVEVNKKAHSIWFSW